MNIHPTLKHCTVQAQGQLHEYLYLSTFKYTFDNTSTLLTYFLISAGVLILIYPSTMLSTCMYLYILVLALYSLNAGDEVDLY